jgi:signal recognition particle receptor subunit beta
MPVFNFVTGEILLRIACFGPPFGGKSTVLRQLHDRIDATAVSPVRTQQAGPGQTLAFDFVPKERPLGLSAKPRVEIITVPGSPVNAAMCARALADIDGVAFVADSRWDKIEDNVRALDALAAALRQDGAALETTPLVLLFNKRDLADAAPAPYLDYVLNSRAQRRAAFETEATRALNLVPALDALLKIVLAKHTTPGGHF